MIRCEPRSDPRLLPQRTSGVERGKTHPVITHCGRASLWSRFGRSPYPVRIWRARLPRPVASSGPCRARTRWLSLCCRRLRTTGGRCRLSAPSGSARIRQPTSARRCTDDGTHRGLGWCRRCRTGRCSIRAGPEGDPGPVPPKRCLTGWPTAGRLWWTATLASWNSAPAAMITSNCGCTCPTGDI